MSQIALSISKDGSMSANLFVEQRDEVTQVVKVAFTPGQVEAPLFSEVGPASGLVAWYPLVSDTLDYAGVNHAVNNGAVLTAEGCSFGSSAYLRAATPALPSSGSEIEATLSAWIMPIDFSGEGWIVSQYSGGSDLRFIWNTTSSGRMRYFIGGTSITGTSSLSIGVWVHVCVTRKVDGTIDLYLDGAHDGSGVIAKLFGDTPTAIGNASGNSGASFVSRDVRIYDRALSMQEIALLHRLTAPDANTVSLNQNGLYTTGQIKEVIA